MEQALLRVEEAAKVLALGRSKTYEMVVAGELPSIRIGRSVRIPVDSLRRWLEDRTTGEIAPICRDNGPQVGGADGH